ncbi:Na-K-Cl cotransporter [Robertkochia marina]|uniref:Na-K-Cl cotransporter n=1 Tax=Robertkochia marina TaxID=1227945 RepID=A0A4S3M3N7_9FLAO|nr:amino acid permease [Robertkochia marina]THD69792.1 Na-K-Cl cotransporter [Robertkochia marina]TRZ46864.1 Na-K-Cl cotransporter [Robertkochia marina]
MATNSNHNQFNTVQGVFVPTLLTILGIILFLRLPWVVGNAGVGGAILIILISVSITLLTSLSLSSVITNIRIGFGGAFAIISRSLGLEIGGSIGIPLYLSQAIAVAMYIFGFREGWLWIFPDHYPLLVDLTVFLLVFGIAYTSTKLAFKIQYVILALIIVAITSIVLGFLQLENFEQPKIIGDFVQASEGELIGANFWLVFAVFFPAVTGIMAGLNMSGDLKNPRKSIPKGTLLAVAITTLIYIALAIIAAYMGEVKELVDNYTFFIDHAYMPALVLAGLAGATFSSALTSFIGAPRVLEAIARNNILPFSDKLSKRNNRGEPAGAILFTGIIVLAALLLRELNLIAPLITLFFLITYVMINLVVLIEQSLSLPSFRPTFSIPIFIPLAGTLLCLLAMFVVSPLFSLVSIITVFFVYAYLMRKHLNYTGGYARSGLFTALAKWATERSASLSQHNEPRSWQPDLLVAVEQPRDLRSSFRLIYAIVHPKGSLKVLGIGTGDALELLKKEIPLLVSKMKRSGDSITYSFIESEYFDQSVQVGIQALDAAYFKPNSVFLRIDSRTRGFDSYELLIRKQINANRGVLLYIPFAQVGLGLEKSINLWLADIPENWETKRELGNNDLAILMGLLLEENWDARLNIILELNPEQTTGEGQIFLKRLKESARLPKNVGFHLVRKDTPELWNKVPPADLSIASFDADSPLTDLLVVVQNHRSSFLFTADSGRENAQF